MELLSNFDYLKNDELENINGGGTVGKVVAGVVFVGTTILTVVNPPVGIAARVAAGIAIGGSAIGVLSE